MDGIRETIYKGTYYGLVIMSDGLDWFAGKAVKPSSMKWLSLSQELIYVIILTQIGTL